MVWWLVVLWAGVMSSTAEDTVPGFCRYRGGLYLPPRLFNKYACSQCFSYLFSDHTVYVAFQLGFIERETLVNGTQFGKSTVYFELGDRGNDTAMQRVCEHLDGEECPRWKACCNAATLCCDNVLRHVKNVSDGHCPHTWDGFHCWAEQKSDTVRVTDCPMFIEHKGPMGTAYKHCTKNATWWRNPETNMEWTNYSTCIDVNWHKVTIYIRVGCSCLSIIFLVPATVLFLCYRSLYMQHRVQIHINLFISFLLAGIIYMILDFEVMLDRIVMLKEDSLMHRNTAGCKLLHILTRYIRTTNFMWMSFEGYYLHRLIVKAFTPPKKIWWFFIVGWGFPVIPVVAYAIVRIYYDDTSCWVHQLEGFEWIIYSPCLICLVINLFFLFNILRILLTKLQAHPNEPSNYRKAIKATFILIPLFGLQLLAIIYRPENPEIKNWYEVVSALLSKTQGFMVAMIFCFCNGEVLGHLKKTYRQRLESLTISVSDSRSGSLLTARTSLYSERSNSMAQHSPVRKPSRRTSNQSPPLWRYTSSGRSNSNSLPHPQVLLWNNGKLCHQPCNADVIHNQIPPSRTSTNNGVLRHHSVSGTSSKGDELNPQDAPNIPEEKHKPLLERKEINVLETHLEEKDHEDSHYTSIHERGIKNSEMSDFEKGDIIDAQCLEETHSDYKESGCEHETLLSPSERLLSLYSSDSETDNEDNIKIRGDSNNMDSVSELSLEQTQETRSSFKQNRDCEHENLLSQSDRLPCYGTDSETDNEYNREIWDSSNHINSVSELSLNSNNLNNNNDSPKVSVGPRKVVYSRLREDGYASLLTAQPSDSSDDEIEL